MDQIPFNFSARSACSAVIVVITIALCLVLCPGPAAAHDVAVDKIVTVLVRQEGERVDLLLRVPLDLLTAVPFPTARGEIEVQSARPALERALGLLGEAIAVFDNGRRVAPSAVAARLSLPSDQSFADYHGAAAHLARATPADAEIYSNQGYFDGHLRYAIGSPHAMLSLRSTLRRDLGDSVKLTVRYLPADGTERQLLMTSRSGRVTLNPTPYEAARFFFVAGIRTLLTGTEYLLLLVCLAVPLRTFRDFAVVGGALTAGCSAVLTGTAFNLDQLGSWFGDVAAAAMAASLVYLAVENIVRSTPRRWEAAAALGVLFGFGLSYLLRQRLPFAGPHVLVSVVSFNAGIQVVQLLVAAAVTAGAARLMPDGTTRRAGNLLLSAVIVHTGWHWAAQRASPLWQAGWPQLDAPSLHIAARWIAGVGLAIVAGKYLARRLETRSGDASGRIVQTRVN